MLNHSILQMNRVIRKYHIYILFFPYAIGVISTILGRVFLEVIALWLEKPTQSCLVRIRFRF